MADNRPDDTPPDALLESLLSADESAVVAVLPGETIDAVAAKVRAAGTRRVQLLVPDGVAIFRPPRSFLALQALLGRGAPHLLLVSGDEATLEAARRGGVEVLGVAAPPRPARRPTPQDPYATRPIDDRDAAFLRELDQLHGDDSGTPSPRDVTLAEDDAPAPAPARRPPRRGASDALAALDRLSDEVNRRSETKTRGTRPAPPARRDETRPMRDERRRSTALSAPPARPARRPPPPDVYEAAPVSRVPSTATMALILVIAILAAGVAWALLTRTTVFVSPPASAAREVPFQNQVIPVGQSATGDAPAVQAAALAVDAEYALTAQVQSEIISPVGRARGQVTIQNPVEQAIALPEGTELVGDNAAGEVVRFAIVQPVTLPPAQRIPTNTGFNFVYGAATIEVVARSPGSASNVGADAIKQIVIPGQPPLISDRPNQPIIRHAPIGGGTEEPQRVVTDAEVQRVLGDALTNLYNIGVQQLQNQASAQGLTLDPATVRPSTVDLQRPESYDPPVVSPPPGQPADPANPSFTVTVRTRFTGLATPGAPVEEQLRTVAGTYFQQQPDPPCRLAERQEIPELRWTWDGQRLAIDGLVRCIPRDSVSVETLERVRGATVGQSRVAAEAGLDQLVELGLIGGYRLPDREEMPRFEFLIDVQVEEGPAAGP